MPFPNKRYVTQKLNTNFLWYQASKNYINGIKSNEKMAHWVWKCFPKNLRKYLLCHMTKHKFVFCIFIINIKDTECEFTINIVSTINRSVCYLVFKLSIFSFVLYLPKQINRIHWNVINKPIAKLENLFIHLKMVNVKCQKSWTRSFKLKSAGKSHNAFLKLAFI